MKEEIQLIKLMQNNFGGHEFTDKGYLTLVSHLNLALRKLICQSQNFSSVFCKNKIGVKHLELAMSDMNFEGFFDNSVQKNLRSNLVQCQQFEDYQEDIVDVEVQIKKLLDNKIIKSQEPQLYFDWMIVQGQLQNVKQIPKQQKFKQKKLKNQNQEKLSSGLKISKKGIILNKYYLQQLNPNIITDQSHDFLTSFLQILRNLEEQIDVDFLKVDSKKFHYRKLKKVQVILPFLIFYLYKSCQESLYNGYSKKILQVEVLDALLQNAHINFDSHIHFGIEICLHYIFQDGISKNQQRDDKYLLREKSANFLLSASNKFYKKV